MSKRAKALAKQIDDILEQGSMGTKGLPEAAALIDAELRKERERAANSVRQSDACWMHHNGFDRPMSCDRCAASLSRPGYCNAVAAILAEEEPEDAQH